MTHRLLSRLPAGISRQRTVRRVRRGAWLEVRWVYSLIFPIALILLVMTLLVADPRSDLLELRVASSVSGEPVPGAVVRVGEVSYAADETGKIIILRPDPGTAVTAAHDGYTAFDGEVSESSSAALTIQMKPSIVNGVLTDSGTGAAIEGAEISLLDAAGNVVADTRTDSDGAYVFKVLPGSAVLRVDAGAHGTIEEPVQGRQLVNFSLQRGDVHGAGLDDAGKAVWRLVVETGARAVSATDAVVALQGVAPSKAWTAAPEVGRTTRSIEIHRVIDRALMPLYIRAVPANRPIPWHDPFNVTIEALGPDVGGW